MPQVDPNQAGEWAFANAEERRAMRQNSRLWEEEFEQIDEAAIEVARERLRIVDDVRSAGLVKQVDGIGVMTSTYRKLSDMTGASQSMTGRARNEADRPEQDEASVPIPITFKDFDLDRRQLEASRRFGEAFDDTAVRLATRQVSELLEDMVINGGNVTHAGDSIPGLTNFADRNTVSKGAGTSWDSGITNNTEILQHTLDAIQAAKDANYYGPYGMYIPPQYETVVEDDLKAESDRTVRNRLEAISSLEFVRVADYVPEETVLLVQMTTDVLDLVVAEDIDVIDRQIEQDFVIPMKVWAALAPRLKSDYNGATGIVEMTLAD